MNFSRHQELLPLALRLAPSPRRRTPPIPHANDLVLALLARRNRQAPLVGRLGSRLQNGALPPAFRQRAPRVRELEGRLAAQLEPQLGRSALVDVRDHLLALRDVRLRHGVDGLRDADGRAAVARAVRDRGDGEVAGYFRPARERRLVNNCFAVAVGEVVVDGERRRSGEAERRFFADAKVFFGFHWSDSGRVMNGYLNARLW